MTTRHERRQTWAREEQDTMKAPGVMTAVQWLLAQPAGGKRSKAQIDAALKVERTC